MAANELIFSVVLMVTPMANLEKPMKDWKATPTVSHIIAPEFADSISCQRMALTFISQRGVHFKGKYGTKYQNVEGIINGAWCTVHANVKTKVNPNAAK